MPKPYPVIDIDPEILAGIESEIDERHDEILGANTPWEPVFSNSPIVGLEDTVIMDDEFHLPIEVD